MRKIFICVSCLCLAVSVASAQPPLKNEVLVYKPVVADKSIIKESEVSQLLVAPHGQTDKKKTGHSYWVVFSDRANNPVYNNPDGKKKCGALGFGEKLRIAEIKNGYGLVYDDPKTNYPEISPLATSKGWIPLDNLLLWDRGLSDDVGISQKAVVASNLDKAGQLKDSESRKRYDSPSGGNSKTLKPDMRFYFILKRIGGKVLLGLNSQIDNSSDIFGWVDVDSFVPWNSRTCLEPTWSVENVPYFAKNNIIWKVYPSRDKMTGMAPAQGVFRSDISRKKEEQTDRYGYEYSFRLMPKTYLRFPILDGGDDQTYYCTTFGTLNKGESKSKGLTDAEKNKLDDSRDFATERLRQRRVVNLVIVIDGTSSMKPYFKSVMKVLNEIDKFFVDTKVNVGVTIYRDKEDKEYITESFPSEGMFTEPKNQNLRKWLESGGKYTVKSIAPGNKESVFYGMNTALDLFFPSDKDLKYQSNIMLVIGDCGDNGKMKVTRETIIDKLVAQNISLMGFQVTNKRIPDYTLFNNQLCDIMKRSVQARYDKMSKNPQIIKPTELPDGRGYEMSNSDGLDFYLGIHRNNPKFDEPMLTEDLTLIIEEILNKWKNSVDALSTYLANIIDHGGAESFVENDVEGTQLIKDAVVEMLGGDESVLDVLLKQNALLSFRGYAKKKQDTRDLFKVVVFMPDNELKNLLQSLEDVYTAAQKSTMDRRPYYEAMKSLAKSVLAQKEIKTASYYAILAKVFGIADYKPKHNYSLEDILDPNVVSRKEYGDIVQSMNQSIENLQKVVSSDYPFTYETAGTGDKYYWLPSEYLPL